MVKEQQEDKWLDNLVGKLVDGETVNWEWETLGKGVPTTAIFLRDSVLFAQPNMDLSLNYHDTVHIVVPLEGKLSFRPLDGEWQEQSAVVIDSDATYECKVDGVGLLICLMLDSKKEDSFRVKALKGKKYACLGELDKNLLEELGDYFQRKNLKGLGTLMDSVFSNWLDEPHHLQELSPKVDNAFQMIERNPSHDIWEEEVAKKVNYTFGRLNFQFYGQTGVSVKEFILWTSLAVVVAGLLNKEKTDLILNHAGFASFSDFSHLFSKRFGVSPQRLLAGFKDGVRGGAYFRK